MKTRLTYNALCVCYYDANGETEKKRVCVSYRSMKWNIVVCSKLRFFSSSSFCYRFKANERNRATFFCRVICLPLKICNYLIELFYFWFVVDSISSGFVCFCCFLSFPLAWRLKSQTPNAIEIMVNVMGELKSIFANVCCRAQQRVLHA